MDSERTEQFRHSSCRACDVAIEEFAVEEDESGNTVAVCPDCGAKHHTNGVVVI